jgi:hypothetical protein
MGPLNLAVQGVTALADVGMGIYGYRKANKEQKAAQGEFDRAKTQYMNQDLSNPYLNMENTMEDLTVNTQAAQFAANQQNQGLANTMASLGSAAGGSGIAALAQSLANQQSQNAVQASASIGQQEASNQAAAAQQAGKIQSMEREGDLISRDLKRTQFTTEFGMANQDLRTANLAKQQATQAIVGGVGDAVTGGIGYKASLDASQQGSTDEPSWAQMLTGIGM